MDYRKVAVVLLVLTLTFSIAAADDYTRDIRVLRDTGLNTGSSGISVMGLVYTDDKISASDIRVKVYDSDMNLLKTLTPGLFIELSSEGDHYRYNFGIFTELSQSRDYIVKVYLNGNAIDTEHYYADDYDNTDSGAVYNDYYASQESYSTNVEIKDISFDNTLFAEELSSGSVLIKNYGSTTAKFKFEYTYAGETFQNAEYVYIPANTEKKMTIFIDVPQEDFIITAKVYGSAYTTYSEKFGVAYRYKHFAVSAPQGVDTVQGNKTDLSISIKNDGYEADTYKISVSGWENYTVEPTAIDLSAGSSKKVNVTMLTSKSNDADTYPTHVIVCNSENKCKQNEVALLVRVGNYSEPAVVNETTNFNATDTGITGLAISGVGEVYKNWPYLIVLIVLAIGVYIVARKKFVPAAPQDEAVKIEAVPQIDETVEIETPAPSDTETTIPIGIKEIDNTETEQK